jgi:hypothetical protein
LYGGQAGVLSLPHPVIFGGLYVAAFAKVGVYADEARNRSLLATQADSLRASGSVTSTAFAGEFGASAEFRITEHLSIFSGYSLLLLESVAVASDQIRATDFFDGTGIDDRGVVVYHGANLAIELRR